MLDRVCCKTFIYTENFLLVEVQTVEVSAKILKVFRDFNKNHGHYSQYRGTLPVILTR